MCGEGFDARASCRKTNDLSNPLWKTIMCHFHKRGKCVSSKEDCFYAHGHEDSRQFHVPASPPTAVARGVGGAATSRAAPAPKVSPIAAAPASRGGVRAAVVVAAAPAGVRVGPRGEGGAPATAGAGVGPRAAGPAPVAAVAAGAHVTPPARAAHAVAQSSLRAGSAQAPLPAGFQPPVVARAPAPHVSIVSAEDVLGGAGDGAPYTGGGGDGGLHSRVGGGGGGAGVRLPAAVGAVGAIGARAAGAGGGDRFGAFGGGAPWLAASPPSLDPALRAPEGGMHSRIGGDGGMHGRVGGGGGVGLALPIGLGFGGFGGGSDAAVWGAGGGGAPLDAGSRLGGGAGAGGAPPAPLGFRGGWGAPPPPGYAAAEPTPWALPPAAGALAHWFDDQ